MEKFFGLKDPTDSKSAAPSPSTAKDSVCKFFLYSSGVQFQSKAPILVTSHHRQVLGGYCDRSTLESVKGRSQKAYVMNHVERPKSRLLFIL